MKLAKIYIIPSLLCFLPLGFFVGCGTRNSEGTPVVSAGASTGASASDSSLTSSNPPQTTQSLELSKPTMISERNLSEIPFDGELVHQFLTELCAFGPRPSGSDAMLRQREYLIKHFSEYCDSVEKQGFQFPYPGNPNQKILGVNLIFRWKPERKERILFCAHYDTLPIPTKNPPAMQNLPFVGAEDNAGGVGILMVLAQSMKEILETEQQKYGVDFVLLDAEEFMFRPGSLLLPNERFCWGSEFYGQQYAAKTPKERGWWYTDGILLDMVTQKDAVFEKEMYSFQSTGSRRTQSEIWRTAQRLGVREFVPRLGSLITDDHIYLMKFGNIPCMDLIDLDYKPWHTHEDTPDKCSPLTAARVGWVLTEWLKNKK